MIVMTTQTLFWLGLVSSFSLDEIPKPTVWISLLFETTKLYMRKR